MTQQAQAEVLYQQAVEAAKVKASVSYVQRKLVISYHRAEDLLEQMIADGHITDYSGRCIEKVQARQIVALTARIAELEAQLVQPSRAQIDEWLVVHGLKTIDPAVWELSKGKLPALKKPVHPPGMTSVNAQLSFDNGWRSAERAHGIRE